jgi:hypothetical protein
MNERTEESGELTRPDTAPDQASLGTPLAVFQPALPKRVVIAVCGAATLGSGAFITFFLPGSLCFGPLLAVWGGFILFLAYVLGRQRLIICSGGVVHILGRVKLCCLWGEISEIVEGYVQTRGLSSRRCSLVKRDGSRIDLTDLSVGQFETMMGTLRPLSEAHGIPWKEEGVKLDPFDWMRWLLYALIGFSILLLVFTGVVLLLVK